MFAENEAGLSKPSTGSLNVRVKDPHAATLAEFVVPLRRMQVSTLILMRILYD